MTALNTQQGYVPSVCPSIVSDVSDREYHGNTAVFTSTKARTIKTQTPAHIQHNAMNQKDTAAFAFGRLVHAIALRPAEVRREFLTWVPPVDAEGKVLDKRFKAGKQAHAEFKVALGSRTEVSVKQSDDATLAATSVAEQLSSLGQTNESLVETSAYAELDGVLCAARPDVLIQNDRDGYALVDVKTTDDLNAWSILRTVRKYGYVMQLAHYAEVLAACGVTVDDVYIVAVEKSAPFLARTFRVPLDWLASETDHLSRTRALWKVCLETDEWPDWGVTPFDLQQLTVIS